MNFISKSFPLVEIFISNTDKIIERCGSCRYRNPVLDLVQINNNKIGLKTGLKIFNFLKSLPSFVGSYFHQFTCIGTLFNCIPSFVSYR